MKNAIEIQDLTKRYGTLVALDHVSLSVSEGSMFGLIGPDGAGKTTLYQILTTLLSPDEGSATVTVSSETSGKLISFDIDEGDSLVAGQQVGLVDTTLLALQQKQLHSQQLSTEKSSPDIAAQAAALRSQIAHQQNECNRIDRLLTSGAATQKQSDDANAQLRTLRGQKHFP